MQFTDLVHILQAAVGPVILISGAGLLLLSMTNRLGRVVDRSRQLIELLRHAPADQRDRFRPQIAILSRRARLITLSITLTALSTLLAACLVIMLFLGALLELKVGLAAAVLFVACMTSLIASLGFFLRDINLSLAALKLELASVGEPGE